MVSQRSLVPCCLHAEQSSFLVLVALAVERNGRTLARAVVDGWRSWDASAVDGLALKASKGRATMREEHPATLDTLPKLAD